MRLNRRYGVTGPTGLYCCEVPSVADLNARICINIIGTADWISHPYNHKGFVEKICACMQLMSKVAQSPPTLDLAQMPE